MDTQAQNNGLTANANIEINAVPAIVWDALTNPEKIKQYFFGTKAESTWQVGGPITFSGEWEGQKYKDKGTILEIEPEQVLKYSYWSSMGGTEDKPENYAIVTYRLLGKGASTLLEILQDGIKDEKSRQHSEENWNGILTALKQFVETDPELTTEEPLNP